MAGTTINTSTHDYANDVCVPGDGMDVANVGHEGGDGGRQLDSSARKGTEDTVEKQDLPPADYSGKIPGP